MPSFCAAFSALAKSRQAMMTCQSPLCARELAAFRPRPEEAPASSDRERGAHNVSEHCRTGCVCRLGGGRLQDECIGSATLEPVPLTGDDDGGLLQALVLLGQGLGARGIGSGRRGCSNGLHRQRRTVPGTALRGSCAQGVGAG